MNIEIKTEFKETVIAFGGNGLPLKDRTQADLADLAIAAVQSRDKSLIALFESLPPLADLQKYKTENTLKRGRNVSELTKVELPKQFTGTDPKEMRQTG